jgi:hypothetical protein
MPAALQRALGQTDRLVDQADMQARGDCVVKFITSDRFLCERQKSGETGLNVRLVDAVSESDCK